MLNAVVELASALHGADREGSDIAHALMAKATEFGPNHDLVSGHDWGEHGPPGWHPSHPAHPHHDLYQEFGPATGGRYWEHGDLKGVERFGMGRHDFNNMPVVPPHLHPDAKTRASRLDSGMFSHGSDRRDPEHEESPLHSLYLASPAAVHAWLGDSSGSRDYSKIQRVANDPTHPAHESHPDHHHYLAGIAEGILPDHTTRWAGDMIDRPYGQRHLPSAAKPEHGDHESFDIFAEGNDQPNPYHGGH